MVWLIEYLFLFLYISEKRVVYYEFYLILCVIFSFVSSFYFSLHFKRMQSFYYKSLGGFVKYKTILLCYFLFYMSSYKYKHVSTIGFLLLIFLVIDSLRIVLLESVRFHFFNENIGGFNAILLNVEKYFLFILNRINALSFKSWGYSEIIRFSYNSLDFEVIWNLLKDKSRILRKEKKNKKRSKPKKDVKKNEIKKIRKRIKNYSNLEPKNVRKDKKIKEQNLSVFESFFSIEDNLYFEQKKFNKLDTTEMITLKGLLHYFPEEDAKTLYDFLKFNREERLTKVIFLENINQINRERRNLYLALSDFRNLFFKFKCVLIFFECTILFNISIPSFNVNVGKFALIQAFGVFLFLGSLKEIFESFFFFFFIHPYDTGDKVIFEDEILFVEKINLLSTEFCRWNTQKVFIPNTVLAKGCIQNIKKSLNQKFSVELMTLNKYQNKLADLKMLITNYVKNCNAFSNVLIHIDNVVFSAFLNCKIIVTHKSNFQNSFYQWSSHTKFMKRLLIILKTLKIGAFSIKQPISYRET